MFSKHALASTVKISYYDFQRSFFLLSKRRNNQLNYQKANKNIEKQQFKTEN